MFDERVAAGIAFLDAEWADWRVAVTEDIRMAHDYEDVLGQVFGEVARMAGYDAGADYVTEEYADTDTWMADHGFDLYEDEPFTLWTMLDAAWVEALA